MHSLTRLCRYLTIGAFFILFLGVLHLTVPGASHSAQAQTKTTTTFNTLAPQLRVGDVVFIRTPYLLLRKVAEAEETWTNHVGVVIDASGAEPLIAESRIPRSEATSLSHFLARSENGRVAIRRLPRSLSPEEQQRLVQAAQQRFGQWYDLGFNLHSSRQFCSKYVREVMLQATGEQIGDVQTFAALLAQHPQADQRFWTWWYLGSIPWQRETVTPGSQLYSPRLKTVFDGRVVAEPAAASDNSKNI